MKDLTMKDLTINEIADDIKGAVDDILDLLPRATMSYENAVAIDTALKGIHAYTLRLQEAHLNAVDRVADRLRKEHEEAISGIRNEPR